ncbi:MAG TPA: DUF2314 domain-containing protein [Verrucomicrobiae bacterium]
MQSLFQPPGGEKTWSAVALLLGGAVSISMAASGNVPSPAISYISGFWFLASGFGVWRNRLWGYWLGLLATAFVSGRLAILLISDPFEWSRLIFCLCFAWFTVALFMERPRRSKDDRPLISLVLLLKESRTMDVHSLSQRLSIAWGVPVETAKDKDVSEDENVADKTYIVGSTPIFMIGHQGGFYLVNNFDRPYFDEPDKAAEDCAELRLRKVIREHRAWLSVDLLRVGNLPERTTAYRQIAHLVAELAGDDCLAVYCPESGHLNLFDNSLIDELRSENPLEVFQKLTHLPIIQVDGEDPEMVAAVAEARRRWPEFVSAFGQRQLEQSFAIKAPITRNGNTEFIWVSVDKIEGDQIHGRLDNDPGDLGELKAGDKVTVTVAELNDWVFSKGEDMTGLFTTKVLMKKQGK